jgi:hypothetical protein
MYLRFCVILTITADYFTLYQLIDVVKRFWQWFIIRSIILVDLQQSLKD